MNNNTTSFNGNFGMGATNMPISNNSEPPFLNTNGTHFSSSQTNLRGDFNYKRPPNQKQA